MLEGRFSIVDSLYVGIRPLGVKMWILFRNFVNFVKLRRRVFPARFRPYGNMAAHTSHGRPRGNLLNISKTSGIPANAKNSLLRDEADLAEIVKTGRNS